MGVGGWLGQLTLPFYPLVPEGMVTSTRCITNISIIILLPPTRRYYFHDHLPVVLDPIKFRDSSGSPSG